MATPSGSSRLQVIQSYSRIAALVGIHIGIIVLLGWEFEIPAFKSVLPGLVPMKVNTAFCLILTGTSILFSRVEPVSTARRRAASICAGIVLLVGALTVLEYQTGFSLGIDQLIFTEPAGVVGTSAPGRMASISAVALVLLAISLLFLDAKTQRGNHPAELSAIAALTLGVFGLYAYCIDTKALYNVTALLPMALHTTIALIALSVAVLFARPARGFMGIVAGDGLGCSVARRLSVAAIIVPFVLAWLRLAGQRASYFSAPLGTALLATANVVIFMALIWWYALSLNRMDAERKRGERRLAAQYAVGRILAESTEILDAEPKILQGLGETLGWDMGAVWEVSQHDKKLHNVAFWSASGTPAGDFEESTRHASFEIGIGLPGRAWKRQGPVWIYDLLKDENFPRAPVAAKAGLRSAFAFPIAIGEESTHVFELFSRKLQAPDEALLHTLVSIAGQISQFTQRMQGEKDLREANAKLAVSVKELERKGNEIALLSQLGSVLHSCLTFAEASKVIAQFGLTLFPQTSGGVYVITASRDLVELVVQWGESSLGENVFAPDDCWALRTGHSNSADNLNAPTLCLHASKAQQAAFLCIPMMVQSESLGILHLKLQLDSPERTGEAWENDKQSKHQLALAVAEHIGLALANLRLRNALHAQSIRDPLTNLYNRRHMEESLHREFLRATRNGRPLGTIMLDIDHFKRYNDTFGHEAGDTVLRELGVFISSKVRGDDIACRYGGEEFTLIMPDATLEVTRQRAEELCEGAQHLNIVHQGLPLGVITISLGVAGFPEHGKTPGAVLSAADKALYQAKKQGRNRVVIWDPEPVEQSESAPI